MESINGKKKTTSFTAVLSVWWSGGLDFGFWGFLDFSKKSLIYKIVLENECHATTLICCCIIISSYIIS